MKIIQGSASYIVDGKEILIISDSYKGSPIIAHHPDLILISIKTYSKYKDSILKRNKIRIEFLDGDNEEENS